MTSNAIPKRTKRRKWSNNAINFMKAILLFSLGILLSVFWNYVSLNALENVFEDFFSIIRKIGKNPPKVCTNLEVSTNRVQYIKWNVSEDVIMKLQSNNIPAVIIDSPSAKWAISKWNLLHIDVNLTQTKWQSIPLVISSHERERGGMLGSQHDRPLLETEVSLQDFLKSAMEAKQFLHWTGNVSIWESAVGQSSTGASVIENNWEIFSTHQNLSRETDDETETHGKTLDPILSISQPGVVLQSKYDIHHNVIVQIIGTSRFLLFSPQSEMYIFPNIHRSYRQSQVFLEDTVRTNCSEIADRFPDILKSKPIEVRLYPGQAMYIPPYWHFREESVTLTLSMTIPSRSAIENEFNKIYWHPLPFGPFQDQTHLRVLASCNYLKLLHLEASLPGSLQSYALALYTSRFKNLFPESVLSASHNIRIVKSLCPVAAEGSYHNITHLELIDTHSDDFLKAAGAAGGLLRAVNTSIAVKSMFFEDYVEALVRWAVGPQSTALLIRSCLAEGRL